MKKIILLCTIITGLILNINAQTIVQENGKMGIQFPSGKPAVRCEYDNIVNAPTGGIVQPLYYCMSKGRYGIYNMYDSSFTGCLYDSVFMGPASTLMMTRNHKTGFVAHDLITLEWKIIEPAYDQIEWFRKEMQRNYDHDEPLNGLLHVRIDTLWGLVSQGTGDLIAPIKFRYRFENFDRYACYVSVDRNNQRQTLFDPKTQHEYHMSFLADVVWKYDWNMLIAVDYFTGDSIHTRVWNLSTGAELWHNASHASTVEATMYTPNIIMIHEEYTETWNNIDKDVYSFYTISDNTARVTYTGDSNTRVSATVEADRVLIYASKTYNGKLKSIGEIMK